MVRESLLELSVMSIDPVNPVGNRAGVAKSGGTQAAKNGATSASFDALLAATQASTVNPERHATGAAGSPPPSGSISDIARSGIKIDEYFTPKLGAGLPPLLLPTRANIDALSRDVSGKLRQFLADNGIPSAPSQITYGSDGKIQFPGDYAYADKFEQALANNPVMESELRTVNALTSHFVAMQPSMAFSQAYGAAQSQAEIDAVMQKYSYLFSGSTQSADIALTFAPNGTVEPTANGKHYSSVNFRA
ncbi:MAG: hypothetical protein HY852_13185 [Bradyrhizobium sp.]|uniref:hypothetical protein n=1 Tax=Bradyrhizobium sp. TaxID=376 RepID=UPI0025BE0DDA|nr:hypothetical protein [Bradyrhizobium sp.]MBI5262759.1 hypothetical protein [Bradyrhizobium sp.]